MSEPPEAASLGRTPRRTIVRSAATAATSRREASAAEGERRPARYGLPLNRCGQRVPRPARYARTAARYCPIVDAARASAAIGSGPIPSTTIANTDSASATLSAGDSAGSSTASGARMYM